MKKIKIVIWTVLILFVANSMLFADDCLDGMTEAKALYNSGNFQKAKELFEYVKSECPQNYTEASNWIAKCDDASNPKTSNTKQSTSKTTSSTTSYLKVNGSSSNSTVYLMNTSSSKTITISCSTSYSIHNIPSWCSITNRTSTSFTLNYQANPNTYTRCGSIDIGGGGTSIRLSLEQAAKTTTSSNSSSTTSSSNASSLKVNKSLIVATASGVTEYITVTCNKAWEIQYPSGGMYTATRSGNSVKVVISANTTTSTRTDFFNIRTTDGKETIKISLSQSGKSTSSYSSYNSGYSSYNRSRLSAYQRYKQSCGNFEVTWGGLNTSFCTAWEVGFSALRLRWGWFQLCPIEGVIGVNLCDEDGDWVGFDEGTDIFAYQPTINFVIPTDDYQAIYFGAGPSVTFDGVWFKIEAGYRLHWGDWANSDIFMRYDGTFTFGVSIQWSSYY